MVSVLIVEADSALRDWLVRDLMGRGHAVRSTAAGLEALREVSAGSPDAVVIGLGLPDLEGGELLRMLRGVSAVPALVLAADEGEREAVRLLGAGADDYVIRPVSGDHLHARLAALLRRRRTGPPPAPTRVMEVGGIRIDVGRRVVTLDGVPMALTRREFDLLAYLARTPGRIIARREILQQVWHQAYGDRDTLDVHLSWLRRKLGESAARPRYLHTVRGVGVRMQAPSFPRQPG